MAEDEKPSTDAQEPGQHDRVINDAKKKILQDDEGQSFSIVDGLRVIAGLFLLSSLVSYFVTGDSFIWNYNAWWTNPRSLITGLVRPFQSHHPLPHS